MFTEYLHHASAGREAFIVRRGRPHPLPVCCFKNGFKAVRERHIGAENTEIAVLGIQIHDVTQKGAEYMRIPYAAIAWRRWAPKTDIQS